MMIDLQKAETDRGVDYMYKKRSRVAKEIVRGYPGFGWIPRAKKGVFVLKKHQFAADYAVCVKKQNQPNPKRERERKRD